MTVIRLPRHPEDREAIIQEPDSSGPFWTLAFVRVTALFRWRSEIGRMTHGGWVYILASQRNGTLYIGITNDLARRIYEHREGLIPGFTKKYSVRMLVWYCRFDDIRSAISEEKRLKAWKRRWKLELIERENPSRRDLYDDIVGFAPASS